MLGGRARWVTIELTGAKQTGRRAGRGGFAPSGESIGKDRREGSLKALPFVFLLSGTPASSGEEIGHADARRGQQQSARDRDGIPHIRKKFVREKSVQGYYIFCLAQ